jgi:hypothetical protein
MATFFANYPSVESAGSGGNAAAGPTGAPVPGDADYIGFSVGGTLTGVSAATPLPVTIESGVGDLNVNIAEYGGVAVALGQTTEAASMPVVIASNQSAIPVTQSGTWNVGLNSGSNTIGAISNTSFIATQASGANLHVDVDNFPATQPVSGTVTALQGTSPWIVAGGGTAGTPATGVVTVQGITGGTSIPVTGTFNNSSVAPVPGAPPADATYVGGLATTAAPTYVTGDLEPLSLNLSGGLRVDGSGVTQPVSGTVTANAGTGTFAVSAASLPLPTGTSTAALQSNVQSAPGTPQTVALTIQGNASAVAVPVSGTVATTAPVNSNASFFGSVTVTTTEASTALPANAVGIVFEAESGNATNIRWGMSNSATAILSTTSGVLMEPGRSIDFLPVGTGTYLHYISTAAGSNVIDIQFILSH